MRVGIAASGSQPGGGGGVNVYTHRLVQGLADHDEDLTYLVLTTESDVGVWHYRRWPAHVQFVCLRDVEKHQPLAIRACRRIRRAAGFPVPLHYGPSYLARQIDELGLDVLHYPRTIISPASVKTTCVLTFFDLQHEYYPEFFTDSELEHRARTYRASVNKARHLIVPSSHTQKTLAEKYGVCYDHMSLIPVGLPDSFRRVGEAEVNRVRAKYGLPDQFVYYPANPWPHKNHARLMAAMRILRACYGEAPILVLSGRLRNEPRDALLLAIAAGMEDRVVDLGFVPESDLPPLYSAASLLVFPSLFEGLGMPLIEAMGCGCPIAAAEATAIPETVDGAALLFDPLDANDIAGAVHRLLSDEELRQALVREGYRQVRRFDWGRIVPRVINVYRHVVEGEPVSSTRCG